MTAVQRDPHGSAHLQALGASVRRLRATAEHLSDDDLRSGAYPSRWSIADVLSHLGSGAVITQRRLEDALAGRETPQEHAPGVWQEWNAKTPTQQRSQALEADADLLARLEAVPADERGNASFPMGPMTLSFTDFVAMRLNEHAFHTWDIEVVSDPYATVPPEQAALVIDNLDLVAHSTARPTGDTRTVRVATTDPERAFTIELTPESATVRADRPGPTDLELPAEAFARLVYGRLDPDHTPPVRHGDALDHLRQVFPGP